MELHKPVELVRDAAILAVGIGRYAVHQMGLSAWAEFGDKYGEAVGGHLPHPASIQFHTTGAFEIPDNIVTGDE